MIGDTLLVTPVLLPNASSVKVYFPTAAEGSVWFDFLSGQLGTQLCLLCVLFVCLCVCTAAYGVCVL